VDNKVLEPEANTITLMKKVLLLLVLMVGMSSCSKDESIQMDDQSVFETEITKSSTMDNPGSSCYYGPWSTAVYPGSQGNYDLTLISVTRASAGHLVAELDVDRQPWDKYCYYVLEVIILNKSGAVHATYEEKFIEKKGLIYVDIPQSMKGTAIFTISAFNSDDEFKEMVSSETDFSAITGPPDPGGNPFD